MVTTLKWKISIECTAGILITYDPDRKESCKIYRGRFNNTPPKVARATSSQSSLCFRSRTLLRHLSERLSPPSVSAADLPVLGFGSSVLVLLARSREDPRHEARAPDAESVNVREAPARRPA